MKNNLIKKMLLVVVAVFMFLPVALGEQKTFSNITFTRANALAGVTVYLQTTDVKQNRGTPCYLCWTSIQGSTNTQGGRMWREGKTRPVTTVVFSSLNSTMAYGLGQASQMLEGKTYTFKGRGNTKNSGDVVVSGWVAANRDW